MLTAFAGTSFLVTGPAVIGDLYHPTERATAIGWFLSGTLVGPTIGPVLGGIIVTYTSWRIIFWLQTGLAGVGLGGALFLMPETLRELKSAELKELPIGRKVSVLWGMTNPFRVIRLFQFANLILVGIASGSLVWNMYGMLTPIRYVLNPRFSLSSPAESGLFYLAPGCGYVAGTLVGGRYADYTVRRWISKREGRRISEDRLRSCLPFLGAALPGCMLIYGWTVQQRVGGIAVPVIFMFLGGVSQLFCFPSLNTYCLDVMQGRSAEVVAGNSMIRYLFGAAGSAVVLPAIKKIGVGWFSTISAGFMVIGALGVWAVAIWGRSWRKRMDEKMSS
ncbi:MFS general substrate transporter [Colletotrichum caudatum]|nr:MFS general substrate transporter [Colletotrichum caudatum]